jgi:glycine betaine/choline ABC-type transport system substrate-binding protein
MSDSRLLVQRMAPCSAGVPPAVFLTQQIAKEPARRRRYENLVAFALLVVLVIVGCGKSGAEKIVVGSKNFTEQIVLAELFAQQIEAHSAVRVERRLNLGGTFICHDGLVSGKIDLYPEYTGTALTAILKETPTPQETASDVFRTVREKYRERFNVEVMPPLGFNNTFAMVVRGDDAKSLNLRTISDVAPYAPKWRAGFGYEFIERPDGYRGWVAAYGLHFNGAPRILDLGLLYRALADKQVDLVAGNSTDGAISSLHMVALEDDRHYFPPYEAVPLVRRATLDNHPEVREAIGELAGKISEDEMRSMNYAVDGGQRDPAVVAREFRKMKGL